jgi:thioredoxin-like negative regulator of GroEL
MLTRILVTLPLHLAPGEPFADLDHDAAIAQAAKEQKLCLIDFTATWCGPCKKMEKDTWADAGVREWLAANAIAIQIDTDEEPELAERYEITGIPCVIAIRDGKEFDRSVGYRDPARFLAWAKDVRAGKRASDDLVERSKSLRESTDVEARYDLAKELQQARLYDEALVHYLWLWPATRADESYAGVRLSYMLKDMAELAQRHAPAREAFRAILEDLQKRVDVPDVPEFRDWSEWTAFSQHFGEDARVIAWYEKRRDAEGRLFAASAENVNAGQVVADVFDALMEAERPLDAVRLYPDARARADAIVAMHRVNESMGAFTDEEMRAEIQRYQRESLVRQLSRLHGALLAADRAPEAADVAQKLLTNLDTPEARLGLVRAALDAKRSDESHVRWLDEAEKAGANVRSLRRRIERLEKKKDEADPGD